MRCLSFILPCNMMAGQDEVWKHKGSLVSHRSGFPDVLKCGTGSKVSGSSAGVSNLNSSVLFFLAEVTKSLSRHTWNIFVGFGGCGEGAGYCLTIRIRTIQNKSFFTAK